MRVYLLYAVSRGYFALPTLRAVYLDSKSAKAEAARLNESPYAGRRNRFIVESMKARGEA
jgi:hypothetical protein